MKPQNGRIQTRNEHLTSEAVSQDFDKIFSELPFSVREKMDQIGLYSPALVQRQIQSTTPLTSEFWLAFDSNSRPVARVGAHLSSFHKGLGFVGFFECDPQHEATGIQLLRMATEWLSKKNATQILGPIDLSTWFSYRFQIPSENFGTQKNTRFFWEPHQPEFYIDLWVRAGFRNFHRYQTHGFHSNPGEFPPGSEFAQTAYEKALEKGFRFRKFDPEKLIEKEIPILHELTHRAFDGELLFEPMEFDLFCAIYLQSLKHLDFSVSQIVESPEGKAVGFAFGFMDQERLVLKTIAVLPEYQNLRLSRALTYPLMKDAIERYQPTDFVSALVKEDATSTHLPQRLQSIGARFWSHHYALYRFAKNPENSGDVR